MEHERDIASHGSILDGDEYLEVRLTPLVSFAACVVGWPMVSLLGKLGRLIGTWPYSTRYRSAGLRELKVPGSKYLPTRLKFLLTKCRRSIFSLAPH
jgi:hypothetical protein